MRAHDVVRPAVPASGCLLVTHLAVAVVLMLVGSGSSSSSSWGGTNDEASARLLLTPGDLLRSGSGELCENARMQCTMRTGCQMGLNNFFLGCSSVINGDDAHCTTGCKQALVSLLLATEDGAGLAFVNCNCSGHSQCELRKARVQVCYAPVLEAMAHLRGEGGSSGGGGAPVSCGFARWICEADTSCLAALQYYVQHCGKLFHGSRCTLRCRNSVHILYRQPSAHKLRTCRCQGDEEYDCPRLVANTERLCFQKQRHLHDKSHLQQLPDSNYTEDEDSDDELSEEGDAPPPRVGGGGPASSSAATGRRSDAQRQASSESSSPVPLAGQKEAVFKTRKRRNKPKRKKEKRGKKKKTQSESGANEGRQKNGARKEGKEGKKARNKRIRRRLSEKNGSHRRMEGEKENKTAQVDSGR